MATKKKYIVLNIQQRLNVLKDLQEASLSLSDIAKKYGVDAKTIHRIKKNAAKINAFADKHKREKKRRKIIEPVYDELDKSLYAWFVERRTLRDRVTDAIMLEKAMELKHKLPSCSCFKVSRGWLSKFKRRHGIRLVHMFKEAASDDQEEAGGGQKAASGDQKARADQDEVRTFINDFRKLIRDENINLENIYNMEESGLSWKALPTTIVVPREGRNVTRYEQLNNMITIGLCANALGTHKIMPLIMYKHKSPQALKHEVSLPVIFKSEVNGWMDRTLFLDWFENHFKPCVRENQSQQELFGKVILLLSNCEGRKVSPEIQEDQHFKIMYLPTNITSLIQPMDQGIITRTKRAFRHKILQRVLTYDGGVQEFYKNYTLKNCIDILSSSWLEVTQNNIRNAWNGLIGPVVPSNRVPFATEFQPDWPDMISLITGEECTQQSVTEFLSMCDEVERRTDQQQIKEEIIFEESGEELEETPQERHQEESHEVVYQGYDSEAARNELRGIFERLMFYSTRAPTCIQYMVQGLKVFFLGKEK